MNKHILKGVVSIAVVVALGVGATYAAFTSNTVTISNNQLATGSANIKVCNNTNLANGWQESINPNLTLAGLTSGISVGPNGVILFTHSFNVK